MSASLFKLDKDWPSGRRFGAAVCIAWFVLLSFVSYRIVGSYCYLIYKFGFSHVVAEHLFVTKMPKAEPWTLSNGQIIPGAGFFWWLIVTAVFFPVYMLTQHFIYRLLPERKDKHAA